MVCLFFFSVFFNVLSPNFSQLLGGFYNFSQVRQLYVQQQGWRSRPEFRDLEFCRLDPIIFSPGSRMRDAELLVDISESCGTKPGFPLSHSQSCRRLDGGPDSWPPLRPLGNGRTEASQQEPRALLNQNLLLTLRHLFLCM